MPQRKKIRGWIISKKEWSKQKGQVRFTMGPNSELILDEFAFDTSVVPIEIAMNISINVGTFTYESGQVSNLGGEVNFNAGLATFTVSYDAGSQTITNAFNSVTVMSNDLAPTPPKIETNKQDIIELEQFEDEIKDESQKHFGDIDSKSEMSKEEAAAQDMEEAIISEEASVVEDSNTIVATDMSVSESDLSIESKSSEETALVEVEEVDTSYYVSWEVDL